MKKEILMWIGLVLAGLVLVGAVTAIVVLELRSAKAELPPAATTEATVTEPPTTLPPPPPNVFDPEDFAYGEDGYLTCTVGEYQRGIDVSSFQGDVDWQAVADSGVEFVIIRAGGRGYGEGAMYEDSKAQQNYLGARAAGLKVGAYFFSQAISPEEAVEEAEYLMELIRDWELEMPLVYDWEYISEEARTGQVDRQTVTDCMLSFCDRVTREGHSAMIYFNPEHSRDLFHIEQIVDYPFWLAMYTDWMTYPYKIDMWQYTDQGTVPGIEGSVDINLYFTYVDEVH